MFLKRREFLIILILSCSFLNACSSGELYQVQNGEVQVDKSLSLAMGDQSETVLEVFGSDYKLLSYPGGDSFFYKEKGISVTLRANKEGVGLFTFFFYSVENDNSSRINSLISGVAVEGMKFDRSIDFNKSKDLLKTNEYKFEVEETASVFIIRADLKDGYICTFFFEKKHDFLLHSIQYYRKK